MIKIIILICFFIWDIQCYFITNCSANYENATGKVCGIKFKENENNQFFQIKQTFLSYQEACKSVDPSYFVVEGGCESFPEEATFCTPVNFLRGKSYCQEDTQDEQLCGYKYSSFEEISECISKQNRCQVCDKKVLYYTKGECNQKLCQSV